jgi:two-component system NtrC family sensor kinase
MAAKQKETILVVEDEPAIAQVCIKVLTRLGFDVDIAVDGQVAKDMLIKQDYTLLVVDMRTPRMNGDQLYWHIKENHPHLINRIVFTTGDVMDGDIQNFLEQTGRPILVKPFTPEQLVSAVRKSLSVKDNQHQA